MKRQINVSRTIALGLEYLKHKPDLATAIEEGVNDLLERGNTPNTLASIATALEDVRPGGMSAGDFTKAVREVLKMKFDWLGVDSSVSAPSDWAINRISDERAEQVAMSLESSRKGSRPDKNLALVASASGLSEERADQIAMSLQPDNSPKHDPASWALAPVERKSTPVRAQSPLTDMARPQRGDDPSVLTEAERDHLKRLADRAFEVASTCRDWRLRSKLHRLYEAVYSAVRDGSTRPSAELVRQLQGCIDAAEYK
jgi:hypothetical protein